MGVSGTSSPFARDRVRDRIEPQPERLDGRLGAAATRERAQPCDELDERERLGEVVVTAGVEPGEPVDERVARSEEEHRCLDAARAKRLAEVAPVGVRQADVDHEHIRGDVIDALERIVPRSRRPRRSKPSSRRPRASTPRRSASSSTTSTLGPSISSSIAKFHEWDLPSLRLSAPMRGERATGGGGGDERGEAVDADVDQVVADVAERETDDSSSLVRRGRTARRERRRRRSRPRAGRARRRRPGSVSQEKKPPLGRVHSTSCGHRPLERGEQPLAATRRRARASVRAARRSSRGARTPRRAAARAPPRTGRCSASRRRAARRPPPARRPSRGARRGRTSSRSCRPGGRRRGRCSTGSGARSRRSRARGTRRPRRSGSRSGARARRARCGARRRASRRPGSDGRGSCRGAWGAGPRRAARARSSTSSPSSSSGTATTSASKLRNAMIAPRYVGPSTTVVSPVSRNDFATSSSAFDPAARDQQLVVSGPRSLQRLDPPGDRVARPGEPARRRVLERRRLAGGRELLQDRRRPLGRERRRIGKAAGERDQLGIARGSRG